MILFLFNYLVFRITGERGEEGRNMREKYRGRTAGTQREMERWKLSKRRERGEGGDETERKGKRYDIWHKLRVNCEFINSVCPASTLPVLCHFPIFSFSPSPSFLSFCLSNRLQYCDWVRGRLYTVIIFLNTVSKNISKLYHLTFK